MSGELDLVKDLDPLHWIMLHVLEVKLDLLTVLQMQLVLIIATTAKMPV